MYYCIVYIRVYFMSNKFNIAVHVFLYVNFLLIGASLHALLRGISHKST